ncbi:MAG: hypothetical protein WCP20_02655 [Desulfuromonadales bacterium]
MRTDVNRLQKVGDICKQGMEHVRMRFVGWGAIGLLAMAGMSGVSVADVRAEEPKLTPEYIKKTYPDLYRQIQDGPRLPPPEVDPAKPYDAYPGFFAQPVLKPGQIDVWWENSSFEYSPVYPYLLKHAHMKFSYARSTGNDDGHAWKGGILLALRKDRFTNVIGYEIDQKKFFSTDGSSTYKDVQNFEETALYELNRYLFIEAGMYWQRLSQQYIKDRYVPFVGIGSYNLLQDILDKKKDRLKLDLGFGRVSDSYFMEVVNKIHKDSDSFNALYVRGEFAHKFTDMLTYKQNFTLKQSIDKTPIYGLTTIPQTQDQKAVETGMTKRYDWRWTNSLEFTLNQYVGFLISYTVAFDSNPWPIAAKRDTELLTGFKFAY